MLGAQGWRDGWIGITSEVFMAVEPCILYDCVTLDIIVKTHRNAQYKEWTQMQTTDFRQ